MDIRKPIASYLFANRAQIVCGHEKPEPLPGIQPKTVSGH